MQLKFNHKWYRVTLIPAIITLLMAVQSGSFAQVVIHADASKDSPVIQTVITVRPSAVVTLFKPTVMPTVMHSPKPSVTPPTVSITALATPTQHPTPKRTPSIAVSTPSPAPVDVTGTPSDFSRASQLAKYYVVVDKGTQVVTVLGKDEAGNYSRVIRQMRCSSGKGSSTPNGKFKIYTRLLWMKSNSSNEYAQYASRFNGPILFHSVLYSARDPRQLIRQTYLDLGAPVSHGCVRLTTGDAYWIYVNCPNGTPVEVFSSGGPNVVSLTAIPALAEGMTYDPTHPDYRTDQPEPTTTVIVTDAPTALPTEPPTASPTEIITVPPTQAVTTSPDVTAGSTAE